MEINGNALVDAITPASSSYQILTTDSFTVTAGGHHHHLRRHHPQRDNTAFIDSVSIEPVMTDPITDGDFENPQAGIGNFLSNPSTPAPAWTLTGTTGLTGNFGGYAQSNPLAPLGNQVAYVQYSGRSSRTVTLAAGTYRLSFLAAQRVNVSNGGQTLQVKVGDIVVATVTPAADPNRELPGLHHGHLHRGGR